MKLKVFSILVLAMIILAACAPATQRADLSQAGTVMQVVNGRIVNGSLDAWEAPTFWGPFLWGLFAFILICAAGAVIGGSADSLSVGLGAGAIIGLIVGVILFGVLYSNLAGRVPQMAQDQGLTGMKSGLDQAKYDKANVYLEVLTAPVIAADNDWKDCHKSTNSSTDCAPYEWSYVDYSNPHEGPCDSWAKDSNGNEYCTHHSVYYDTIYVPYFTKMAKYWISVALLNKLATPETGLTPSSVADLPVRFLSDWMVPYDFNSYWYGSERVDLSPSDYTPPADWMLYSQRLAACKDAEKGAVCNWPVVNVWHRYVNWIFASETAILQQQVPDIQTYKSAGLLPTMNDIYSRNGGWAADFDSVQFVGGLSLEQGDYYAWQDSASNFEAYFSNARQGSLTVVFAPRSQVESLGTIDHWADTIKADAEQKGEWTKNLGGEVFQRLMPKNSFFFACEVDGSVISACRIRTAMPQGNEVISETFASGNDPVFTNLTFTPSAFFGHVRMTQDISQAPLSMIQITRDPSSLMDLTLRDDPNGLRRISMKGFDYLQADIKLSQEDIDNVVAKQVAIQQALATRAWTTPLFFLIGLCLVVGFLVMTNGSR